MTTLDVKILIEIIFISMDACVVGWLSFWEFSWFQDAILDNDKPWWRDFDYLWGQELITSFRFNGWILMNSIEMLDFKNDIVRFRFSSLLTGFVRFSMKYTVFRNSHEITESENSESIFNFLWYLLIESWLAFSSLN